jgi:hypothetical protein
MTAAVFDQAQERLRHSMIFVAGLHRSGTTPLTRLLGMHPQVSCFRHTGVKEDEGQHLQDVYPSARAFGGAGRFAFAADAHLTESSPLATPTNAKLLFDSWAQHWDLSRRYLVEKSPPNLLMTRFLQALFPDAKFVVIVRHPVVVALSTRRWAGPAVPLSRLIEHWLFAHETFLRDAPLLESVHIFKYEDLVARPKPTLDGLGRFMGLTSQMPVQGLDPTRGDGYRSEWEEVIHSRRPWRRSQVQRLRMRYEARIAYFGYNLMDVDDVRPFPKVTAAADQHSRH